MPRSGSAGEAGGWGSPGNRSRLCLTTRPAGSDDRGTPPILTALRDELAGSGQSSFAVRGQILMAAHRSLAAANLAAVWPNFAEAGIRRVILSRIIQSDDDLASYAQAIPGWDLSVCFASPDSDTIDDRICHHEPGSSPSRVA